MASDAHRSPQPLPRPLIVGLLLLVALFLGGCQLFGRGGEEQPTEPTPLNNLPPEWTQIEIKEPSGPFSLFSSSTTWQQIDIDDDSDTEFLLFYTYDNSVKDGFDGPVGGVIFDSQTTSAFATGLPPLPLPMQPTGGYIPYRLLPSYVRGQQGTFLAPPSGDTEENTAVTFFQIQRESHPPQETAAGGQATDANPEGADSAEAGNGDNGATGKNDELVLTDGETVLTFAWWRNAFEGYGVTQVLGPAGFRNINGDLSLKEWSESPNEITTLDALYPLYSMLDERSHTEGVDFADPARTNLCRVFRYKREFPDEQPPGIGGQVYQSDIRFKPTNRGIQFCDRTPLHPFYPEGVVVKYLLAGPEGDEREALLWAGLSEQDRQSILQKTNFNPDKDRIQRIETRTYIDYPENYRTVRSPFLVDSRNLMTQVCAEVEPIKEEGGSRLLYFSLLHSRPNIEATKTITVTPTTDDGEHASDRLWVVYVDDASDWGAANCIELIGMDGE